MNYEGGNLGRTDLHSVLVGECGFLAMSWVLDQGPMPLLTEVLTPAATLSSAVGNTSMTTFCYM